jgi:hypothetical protein
MRGHWLYPILMLLKVELEGDGSCHWSFVRVIIIAGNGEIYGAV